MAGRNAAYALHGYFRSSTSFRTRIALNLKDVGYDQMTYNLRSGEQRSEGYLQRNVQGFVPTLQLPDGSHLGQSLAIIEWLDETHPEPPLLPAEPVGRARVRALSYAVALDIHPLNNLRVLKRLRSQFEADQEAIGEWFRHWVTLEFAGLEKRLAGEPETGRFCHGDRITMADICLVAQSINNRRFDVDETPYPTIRRIVETCLEKEAFERALPANQPDAE
ncbi:maleylacetoacetate isomerase [Notoacmeibacter sp. MSK16QG-6]|uniref:maleylacetoacetate isomerase n=1 Tax=Notoacmeibacter sp. MSK16QG-6 TaxID=2957982 RepID=UPI00209E9B6F|nr:maleylacetoacetate isomerase [Notoacmeibacter sp. MSK16QG-6]MCP1198092.1 maleylacetoacetate isomerase [Notoacmeibacter sp. MSK16QG-6]